MRLLNCLFSRLFNPNNLEGIMPNSLRVLIASLFFLLSACGMPISYDPSCASPAECSQNAGKPHGNGGDDTATTTDDCAAFYDFASQACQYGVESANCSTGIVTCFGAPDTGNGSGGSTTITITITNNADGTSTASADDGDPATADCSDGIDNDFDGAIDYPADPGCSSASDTSEVDSSSGSTQCSDGVDNDGDGLVDLADSGCSDATDTDETNASSGSFCQDWDGDGFGNAAVCVTVATFGYVNDNTDCNDSNDNTYPGATEYCNGSDDDCNDIIDDNDSDGDGYYSNDATCVANYNGTRPDLLTDCADEAGHVNVNGWHDEWVHVGQIELGDHFDSDCDGNVDNGLIDFATLGCASGYETSGDGIDDCFDPWYKADRANNDASISEYVPFDDTARVVGGVSVTGNVTSEMTAAQQVAPASAEAITTIVARICTLTPAMDYTECVDLY